MFKTMSSLVLLLCGAALCADGRNQASAPAANRWEKDIRRFEEWDSKNSFPAEAVLFVGSSSIRMWRTRLSFAGLPVINRGFGGSQIADVTHFAHRIVLPYKPRVVVFYAGDNDIAAGKGPARVLEDFRQFAALVHRHLPATDIIFISIKGCRSRWSLWPSVQRANSMIKAFCEEDTRLHFVDAASALLDASGRPDPRFFRQDQLHLNDQGYKAWTALLKPVIHRALSPTLDDTCLSDSGHHSASADLFP